MQFNNSNCTSCKDGRKSFSRKINWKFKTMDAETVHLATLANDVLGTSLVPDIGNEPGFHTAVQGRGDGNCLHSSTSLSLCVDESKSNFLLYCHGISGQETWAVRTSGTDNFSVRTRKNVIPVVRMDD